MPSDRPSGVPAAQDPESLERQFAKLVAQLEYSMFVLTVTSGEEQAGCLVGFATQVSIHPPRFLACVSVKNRTYRLVRGVDTVIVHMVPQDAQEIAELFGGETGDEVDKFARTEWRPGPGGAPVLNALSNWFAGRVLERFDLGDHAGLVLEPIEAHGEHSAAPLTFHQAKWIEPGHEP